jgi:predicted alpha/beta superfamily hydrolase
VIRSVIVVGIENIERRKDLPGPTVVDEEKQKAPKAGGSDKFRAFLREELKPMIAARYRTTGTTAIIGESLAGLFVVETLVVEPALFDGYIAVDPSVWWNEQATARLASTRFAQWKAGDKRFYVANSSEGDESGIEMLTTALRIQAPPIMWKYEPMPDEQHLTIYPRAALRGIRWMFAAP